MFESPLRTKSKLTHPSNNVSFTIARGRQTPGLTQQYWLSIYSVLCIYAHQRAPDGTTDLA